MRLFAKRDPLFVAVIGGAAVDLTATTKSNILLKTSYDSHNAQSFGSVDSLSNAMLFYESGVGRNIASNMGSISKMMRSKVKISFISTVGDDWWGRSLSLDLRNSGLPLLVS